MLTTDSDDIHKPQKAKDDSLSTSNALGNLKKAVEDRTKELELLNKELSFQNEEKEKMAAELIRANIELAFQNEEKEKRALELIIANKELIYQNSEKEKRAAELLIANRELIFQNQEKEKRAAELLIANNELLEFTHVSSHDLQEPLRKIQIFAAYIKQKDFVALSENSKHYISRIEASASHMQQLIEGILELSRINALDSKFETVLLNKYINELSTSIKNSINEKQAVIDVSELGEARIITSQFGIVINNLISNAIKFSKQDIIPTIIIKSEIIPGNVLKKKNTFFTSEQNYCHISVSDNGIGFDPQYKETVFEVFKRLNAKENYTGTGIGLAIVKKIIKNHNGIITAKSELGQGATFDIYLPN